MTIDEAIQYAEDLGTEEENKIDSDKDSPHTIIRRKNTVKDYRQLAEWLRELKVLREEKEQLKRILKVAISNIYKKCSCENSDCDICETETNCDYDNRFTWKLEKEAFDLIYKRGDTE